MLNCYDFQLALAGRFLEDSNLKLQKLEKKFEDYKQIRETIDLAFDSYTFYKYDLDLIMKDNLKTYSYAVFKTSRKPSITSHYELTDNKIEMYCKDLSIYSEELKQYAFKYIRIKVLEYIKSFGYFPTLTYETIEFSIHIDIPTVHDYQEDVKEAKINNIHKDISKIEDKIVKLQLQM